MATSVNSAGTTAIKSEPNVIPMIDIMLVLLIIFMIVTPLIANGFKATMPQGNEPRQAARGRWRGRARHRRRRAGTSSTVRRSRRRRSRTSSRASTPPGTEDKVLYFRADKELQYAKIQEAVEIARQAGVRVMAAITEVKPTGKGLFDDPAKARKEWHHGMEAEEDRRAASARSPTSSR